MRILVGMVLAMACSLVHAAATEPQRGGGLSAHLLPRQVAEQGEGKQMKWGYTLSLPGEESKPPQDRTVVQSASALVSYIKLQPKTIQQNGIWVITTNPNAYSPEELADLEQLKVLCKKEAIPLFICRGAELPNGWKRFSEASSGARSRDRA